MTLKDWKEQANHGTSDEQVWNILHDWDESLREIDVLLSNNNIPIRTKLRETFSILRRHRA